MCVCDKTNNVGVCSLHLFTLQLCTEVKVMSPKVIRNSNICVCVCVCDCDRTNHLGVPSFIHTSAMHPR